MSMCPDITNDALALADDLLASAGIAVTPGLDFDTRRGHHTIRISFAGPSADIEEGMSRLKDFMALSGAKMMRHLVWFYSLLWITVTAQSALSQALNALARLEPGSSIVDTDGGVTATLNLS